MLNGGKAVRDRDGKIVEAAAFQKGEKEAEPGRVKPDRRWFGNTRVISQSALDHFRTALKEQKADPYSVLLKRNKLPMGLLQDDTKDSGGVCLSLYYTLTTWKLLMRHSGLTLSKPSRLAIRLVPKLSENDLGLISVALKNSASLLPPPLNPVRKPVSFYRLFIYLF